MESNMVSENEYISYIKKYFEEHIPDFKLQRENFHGPYWYVEFAKKEVSAIISGDIGFSIAVDLMGTKYPLWTYDFSISERSKTNIQNIKYQLDVLKRILAELNL